MTTKLHALARLTLAGACAAVGFLCVGCEKPEAQADKRVKSYIADSQDKAAAKDRNPTEFTRKDFKYADFLKIVEEGQTKAHTLLQQASMESLASAPARITAKTRLAESNFARASAMLSGITAKEAQLAALIVNIESLSLTIAGNNARLAVLNGANPEKVSAGEGKPALEPRKAYEGGKKTQTEEVAKADKEIAEATKAVEELTAEVKKLDEQRSAAIKDATDKMVQSEQIRGKDAVKLYNESVARRKESQDLEQRLAVRNVELSRQQMRLAQVQQTKKLAEAAVTRARSRSPRSMNAGPRPKP